MIPNDRQEYTSPCKRVAGFSWLAEAHRRLDAAVFAAYGWPVTLTDAEFLESLLALSHERAAASQG
jgi:hypothetical protein